MLRSAWHSDHWDMELDDLQAVNFTPRDFSGELSTRPICWRRYRPHLQAGLRQSGWTVEIARSGWGADAAAKVWQLSLPFSAHRRKRQTVH